MAFSNILHTCLGRPGAPLRVLLPATMLLAPGTAVLRAVNPPVAGRPASDPSQGMPMDESEDSAQPDQAMAEGKPEAATASAAPSTSLPARATPNPPAPSGRPGQAATPIVMDLTGDEPPSPGGKEEVKARAWASGVTTLDLLAQAAGSAPRVFQDAQGQTVAAVPKGRPALFDDSVPLASPARASSAAGGSGSGPRVPVPAGGPILALTETGQIIRSQDQLAICRSLAWAVFPAGAQLQRFTFLVDLQGADLSHTDCTGADFGFGDLRYTQLQGVTCPGASFRGARLNAAVRDWLLGQPGCDFDGATFETVDRDLRPPATRMAAAWSIRFKEYEMFMQARARLDPLAARTPPWLRSKDPFEAGLGKWRDNLKQPIRLARIERWQWAVLAERLPDLHQELREQARAKGIVIQASALPPAPASSPGACPEPHGVPPAAERKEAKLPAPQGPLAASPAPSLPLNPILAVTETGEIIRSQEQLAGCRSLARAVFPPGTVLRDFTFQASLEGADLSHTLCTNVVFDQRDLRLTDLRSMVCLGTGFKGARLNQDIQDWLTRQVACDFTGATFERVEAGPQGPGGKSPAPAQWCRWVKHYELFLAKQARIAPNRPPKPPSTHSADPIERSLCAWLGNLRKRSARMEDWQWTVLAERLPALERECRRIASAQEEPAALAEPARPGMPGPGRAAAERKAPPAASSAQGAPAPLPFRNLTQGLAMECRRRQPRPWESWGTTWIVSTTLPFTLELPPKGPGEAGRRLTWNQGRRAFQQEVTAQPSITFQPTHPRIHSVLEILGQGEGGARRTLEYGTVRVRGAFALPLPFQPAELGGLALRAVPETGSSRAEGLWCALADAGTGLVRTFSLDGLKGGSTWRLPGPAESAADGEATRHPLALAWETLGGFGAGQARLFVADGRNHTVCQLLDGGRVRTWGQPGQPGDAHGGDREARFHDPRGLAIFEDGVFVAERGDGTNGRIRRIQAGDGQVVGQTVLLGPEEGEGAGGEYRFQDLRALAWAKVDGAWRLVVAEGHRVCAISGEDGTVTTLVGDRDLPGSRDLAGVSAAKGESMS